jgi:hypothetical protein
MKYSQMTEDQRQEAENLRELVTPEKLETLRTKISDGILQSLEAKYGNGLFALEVIEAQEIRVVNTIHGWTVEIATSLDGKFYGGNK